MSPVTPGSHAGPAPRKAVGAIGEGALALSARMRGEREGPAAQAREGEVGSAAVPDFGLPRLTPTLSAPGGGERVFCPA